MGTACGTSTTGVASSDAATDTSATGRPDGAHEAGHAHDGGNKPSRDGMTSPHDTGPSHEASAPDASKDVTPGSDAHVPCSVSPDCTDPTCVAEGYMCVPTPPPGWTFALADFAAASACPAGYDAGPTLNLAPDAGPAACSCTVEAMTAPSCVHGALTESYGTVNGAACGSSLMNDYIYDGGCVAYQAGEEVPLPSTFSVDPMAPSGGACTGAAHNGGAPSFSTAQVNTCTLAAVPSSGGCGGASVCVLATASRSACLERDGGEAQCPPAYAMPFTMGGDPVDTRGCDGGCVYAPPTARCVDPVLTFYKDRACATPLVAVPADGGCVNLDAGAKAIPPDTDSVKYTATVEDAACGAPTKTPSPSGSVTVANPVTLCCAE
jgi:hypothetical protein